ncbi:hypothetical protein HanIR_Chr10g0457201 [Helianthus annuus]|nr:hypothetical protein HanIR_Chr10g0457201 [Helianthus annuus]
MEVREVIVEEQEGDECLRARVLERLLKHQQNQVKGLKLNKSKEVGNFMASRHVTAKP